MKFTTGGGSERGDSAQGDGRDADPETTWPVPGTGSQGVCIPDGQADAQLWHNGDELTFFVFAANV